MQLQLLDGLIKEYTRLAPTHLTGTADGELTSDWLHAKLMELSSGAFEVDEQQFTLRPTPWLPHGYGSTGCMLTLDGVSVPCYAVHRPPDVASSRSLDNVAMARVSVMESGGYELSASDVEVNSSSYAAVIVINTRGGNLTTQPRPYDWNGSAPASQISKVPAVTVSLGWKCELL